MLGHEHEQAANIAFCAQTAYAVAHSTDRLFDLAESYEGGRQRTSLRASNLGQSLICALQTRFDLAERLFPDHEMNPACQVIRDMRRTYASRLVGLGGWRTAYDKEAHDLLRVLGLVVQKLRAKVTDKNWLARLDRDRRRVDKRRQDVEAAIDDALEDCPRVLSVRLELYCHVAVDRERFGPHMGFSEAHECLLKFQRIVRGYPLLRYIRSIAHGRETGTHFSFLVLLNGEIVRDHAAVSRELGGKWMAITSGRGLFYVGDAVDRGVGAGMLHLNDLPGVQAVKAEVHERIVMADLWMRYVGCTKTVQISERFSETPVANVSPRSARERSPKVEDAQAGTAYPSS